MKRIINMLAFGFMFFLVMYSCKSVGVKSFYCVSKDKCITVWKLDNGVVYVIPTKYQSKNKPNKSYIKTNNKQFLTLYFSEDLPNKIIVRNEGNLQSSKKSYSIENSLKDKWEYLEYTDKYKAILYKPNAIKFKDVKSTTNYLTLNIQENCATDKTGKKIE